MLCVGLALAAGCEASSDATSSDPTLPGGPNGPVPGAPAAPPGAMPAPGTPGTGDGGEPTPETPIPYVHFDVNHVLSTGQSNSVAHEGRPPISLAQPFKNLMFDVGVMTSGDCDREGCTTYQKPSGFAPLVEGDTFWWPVETMSSGLANQATMMATSKYGKASHDVLVSLAGRNGLTYWCMRKGGCNYKNGAYLIPYDETLKQAADGKALATAQGKSYVVRVATAIHGESDDFGYVSGTPEFPLDGTDGSPQAIKSYTDALIEWQRDIETGVKAITGQTQDIPLLVSQFSGWNDIPNSAVTRMQYDAHVRAPGKVVLVAPGYVLDFAPDCRHYTAKGEQTLGAYFGKAYARIVLEGRRWEPVRPTTVTHAGSVITAKFIVPTPPLVIDTTRVTDPGDYGFEVVDATGAKAQIASIVTSGADTVTITLTGPVPAGARLRYAFTGVPRTCPGRFAGPRGNLRDSDSTPSQAGTELFNWAVHFEVPIG